MKCLTVPLRPVGVGGAGVCRGGAMATPYVGRSVYPISTRGANYAHQITNWHPQIFRTSYGPAFTKNMYISLVPTIL